MHTKRRNNRWMALGAALFLQGGFMAPALAWNQLPDAQVPPGGLLLVTEENQPYNFTNRETGQLDGMMTGIVKEMVARSGVTVNVTVLPWVRAFRMTETVPDVCVFSITRTPERESKFLWVTPVIVGGISVFSRADWPEQLTSPEQLRGREVLSQRNGPAMEMLGAIGAKVTPVPIDSILPMLKAGRVDLIALGTNSGPWRAQQAGVQMRQQLKISTSILGLACQKQSDPEKVRKIQVALDGMHADGTVNRLSASYQ